MSNKENSIPETQQLKSAPKTKLNQAIKAIRKIARSTDANDISFLCDFVLNNYSDVIDEWNSSDTQARRDWLYGEARKSLASKIQQEELDEIIESVIASSPAKELEKEVTYSLGVAAVTYQDVDLKKAFTDQQAQRRASSAAAVQSLQDVALIERCFPELCTNRIDRSIWANDLRTGERRRLTSNEVEFPDLVIAEEHGDAISRNAAVSAIRFLSQKHEFNPAQEMIMDCHRKAGDLFPTTAEADAYLMKVAKTLYNCEDEVLQKGFAQALVCLVQSTFDPKAKPLMYCPTIVGPGGCAKSRSIACLVPEQWRKLLFKAITVSPNKLFNDLTQLSVAWLQELPEVDRYIRGQFAEDFKSVMTAESNSFRAPYARTAEDHERLAGFFGTSNKSSGILTDTTSSCDRRVLPIQIKPGHRIPWQLLDEGMNVEIWAAAYQAYVSPELFDYYLSELPYEAYADLSRIQVDFRESDPLEERLAWELSIRNTLCVPHFLNDCMDRAVVDQKPEDIKRINGLMRTLHHEEWEQKQVRAFKGTSDRIRLWVRKDPLAAKDYLHNMRAYKEAGVSHTPIQREYHNQPNPGNINTVDADLDF